MSEWTKLLARLAKKDETLTCLNIYTDPIASEDLVVLCQMLEGNTYTKRLALDQQRFTCLRGLEALSRNNTLTRLSLTCSNIGDEGAAVLACNNTLRFLLLYGNEIGDGGATALARNTGIAYLNLCKNCIGNDGAAALARNTTLAHLFLVDNNIGYVGATALAHNTVLTHLNLNMNNIGDGGAAALARNTTLRKLYLNENNIGDGGAAALARNTTMVELFLDSNQIGEDGVAALARNTTLTTLSLYSNKITEGCWLVALSENTTLTDIFINFTPASESTPYDTRIDLLSDSDSASPASQQAISRIRSNRDAAFSLVTAFYTGMLRRPYQFDDVTALLQKGVRPYGSYIETQLGYGDTLLHFAVRIKQPALVDLLLDYGADVERNTTNNHGVTYRELAKELGVQLSSAYFGTMAPYY